MPKSSANPNWKQESQPIPSGRALLVNSDLAELGRRVGRATISRGSPAPSVLADEDLYAYVLTSVGPDGDHFVQHGSAPNFQGGVITLCTCKHRMRTGHAPANWVGKWVAGFTSRSQFDRHWLFYLMRIGEAFENHQELWMNFSSSGRQAALRAKNAAQNYLGDVFEPRVVGVESRRPFEFPAYRAPKPARHVHRKSDTDDGWHADIDYTGFSGRRAALLVGEPEYSFVWSQRRLALDPSRLALPRNNRRITVGALLHSLREERRP